MSRQYRDWRDFLTRCIEDAMPSDEPYYILQIANMVGLFSCVFAKTSLRTRIRHVHVAEVKRGMGGLHGNKVSRIFRKDVLAKLTSSKGALILRFVIDDSSVCLVNCHLAAGQTQTVHRNNDIAAILECTELPAESDSVARLNTFVGGGDGSMVLDHDICILNGDLNYRIDTMSRDVVLRAVAAGNLAKLLERDQLLVSRRKNPGFRLRAFQEKPITFAPTYKHDVGSDRYDTSEKRRSPAWCDRILYRGAGKIQQLGYQSHDFRLSDHRPVSATFKLRIKSVSPEKRQRVWDRSKTTFEAVKTRLIVPG